MNYSISSDDVADIQFCDDCSSILLPRNSVAFQGTLIRVTVLSAIDIPDSIYAVLIARSIHSIYHEVFNSRSRLESLVFELGSELEWIGL
jgi:hypothetical protein